jgi:hypothetical protein
VAVSISTLQKYCQNTENGTVRQWLVFEDVLDVDGEDAIYVGSSLDGKQFIDQVRQHETLIWSSQTLKATPFHYLWI